MAAAYAYAALALFQVASGAQQAEMVQANGRLSQRISDMNAKYADLDAYEAEKFGFTQSARYQSVIDSMIGEQKVRLANQNVDVNFGTAKELQEETKLTGFFNQLEIQNAARARARGLRIDASNMRLGSYMQGIQSDVSATAVRSSSYADAVKTGITGYSYK